MAREDNKKRCQAPVGSIKNKGIKYQSFNGQNLCSNNHQILSWLNFHCGPIHSKGAYI